jgi:hypothetical protein
MRTTLLLIACLLAPAFAHAAHLRGDAADSSRILPRWLQVSADGGVSWLQSPPDIGHRYDPGFSGGLALWVKATSRLRGGLRIQYHDLPNGSQAFVGYYDSTLATPVFPTSGFGGGRLTELQLLASVRVWRSVWAEAGAGRGYFDSGFPSIMFIDGVTGEWTVIPGSSGWGNVRGAGLTWEFQPTPRDRLFLAGRWMRMERDGRNLDFVPLRIGYRW